MTALKNVLYFHLRWMFLLFSFSAVAIGLLTLLWPARTDAEVVEHDRSCECATLTAVALNN